MLLSNYLLLKNSFTMTINEKKQLKNYIKGLIRESIGEMESMPKFWNDAYGEDIEDIDPEDEGFYDDKVEGYDDDFEGGDKPYNDEPDDDEIAGLNELRRLAESFARESVARLLSESKKKKGKRKNKKEKTSSKDKTVVSQLNADGTNAAHYFYKLYGVENGTDAQKASARSKGYKKAKGKKNDTGVPYKFTSKERNRLSSLLTDRK